MSIKQKIKTFTGSGSFDIRDEMINDSKDFLDNVEVTTIAQECVNLKKVEDDIAAIEEQLKKKKEEADHISSKVIPELLAEQGLSEIKLADGSKVSVKKEFRCTLPKDQVKREQAYEWLRNEKLGDIIKNNVFVTFGKGEDDKLDLTQAEAIADLINATSEQAAKSALQSLQGEFSKQDRKSVV